VRFDIVFQIRFDIVDRDPRLLQEFMNFDAAFKPGNLALRQGAGPVRDSPTGSQVTSPRRNKKRRRGHERRQLKTLSRTSLTIVLRLWSRLRYNEESIACEPCRVGLRPAVLLF
jgi:hypothetical protein